MRYRLRTLMIALVLAPPAVAWYGWPALQRLLRPAVPVPGEAPPPALDIHPFPYGYQSEPSTDGELAPPLAEPPPQAPQPPPALP